ncbi:hypothetical protein BJ138DRAFT_1011658 [Hygrophoropsis aurantiaca]|uniref:Uncharacterized protein n=1 Tax=Hygrophoropsis aurantiaca TaxID=72124 RepID=A0ACB8A709_9AGAM|nr:hypothetical protein BJ138DRAFT_1011658 [Hygrophoropsis aurantiaca]
MVPTPIRTQHSSRLIITLFSLLSNYVPRIARDGEGNSVLHTYAKRASKDTHSTEFIVFACLIPVLVILSGVFAGLTLGYMSLDETQLNVLSMSGTPQQKLYANKIKPIRKDGHLLLVTLLLANMIVNETLPVISDPVLQGGIQSVVVSTVLIVIFSEIIPQSLCTRHGLYLGAKMAGFTKCLIYLMGIVAWPVAKGLEFVLGAHHGIMYRRAELKELIAMHSSMSSLGGDLKSDTVTIIGATLDLQEKVVKQAMTPIEDVFMLHIDSKLDYELMKKICLTGHSRVPVYEEIDGRDGAKLKKIIGILLVKHCVLLDPKGEFTEMAQFHAVPLRKIPLNKVLFVPNNESLLGILDKFQEGRSHMAIVSRFSVEKAASVKKVAKRSLTQRLRDTVGIGDSSSSESEEEETETGDNEKKKSKNKDKGKAITWADDDGSTTLHGDGGSEKDSATTERANRSRGRPKQKGGHERPADVEMGLPTIEENDKSRSRLYRTNIGMEQSMPADALLTKKDAEEFLRGVDPAVMPLGLITLEDVLEELIGEEIYDEFDPEGANGSVSSYVPTESSPKPKFPRAESSPDLTVPRLTEEPLEMAPTISKSVTTTPVLRPIALKSFSFLRSSSAPPTPRESKPKGRSLPSSPKRKTATLPADVPEDNDRSGSETPKQDPVAVLETMAAEKEPEARNSAPKEDAPPASDDTPVHEPQLKKRSLSSTGIATSVSSPVSRSASPAPSLEAILFDRKRRLAAAAAGKDGSSATLPLLPLPIPGVSGESRTPGVRVTTPSIKGSRFKSSPLGGGDRSGVVVAEQVKEALRSQPLSVDGAEETRRADGDEEGRIPDEKDTEGPDKYIGEGGYL